MPQGNCDVAVSLSTDVDLMICRKSEEGVSNGALRVGQLYDMHVPEGVGKVSLELHERLLHVELHLPRVFIHAKVGLEAHIHQGVTLCVGAADYPDIRFIAIADSTRRGA
jgi:hypothetical protein